MPRQLSRCCLPIAKATECVKERDPHAHPADKSSPPRPSLAPYLEQVLVVLHDGRLIAVSTRSALPLRPSLAC